MSIVALPKEITADVNFISELEIQDLDTKAIMKRFSLQFKTKEVFESFQEKIPEHWAKFVERYNFSHPSNRHLDLYVIKEPGSKREEDFSEILSQSFAAAEWRQIPWFDLKIDTSKFSCFGS